MENLTELENNSTDSAAGHNRDALAYIHFMLGTYIFIANALVIVAVATHQNLKTRANIYIVSLAGTDLTVGIVEWVIGLHNHSILASWFDRTGYACVGMFAFAFFSVDCSMFNMVLIAVDRLVYIMKPFYYGRVVTSKRVKLTIVAVWVIAFAWASVPVFANTYDEENGQCNTRLSLPPWFRAYTNVPILVTGAISTGIIYIAIAVKALQHRNAIYKSIPGMGTAGAATGDASESAKKALHTLRSNLKTLKLFCIVFGLLVFCWSPYYFIEFTTEFVDIPETYYRVSAALGFLNSGVNFFVYPLYNKKFRRAMKNMICPCCKESPMGQFDASSTVTTKTETTGAPARPVLGNIAPAPTPQPAPIAAAPALASAPQVTAGSFPTTSLPAAEKPAILNDTVPPSGQTEAASVQALAETPKTVSSTDPATVPATVSSAVPVTVPATVSSTVPEIVSSAVPETVPATVSSAVPETVSSNMTKTASSSMAKTISSILAKTVSSILPKTASSTLPKTVSSTLPVTVPATVSSASPVTVPATVSSASPVTVPATVLSTLPKTVSSAVPAAVSSGGSVMQPSLSSTADSIVLNPALHHALSMSSSSSSSSSSV